MSDFMKISIKLSTLINISSGNSLVPLGNKEFPESVLMKFYDIITLMSTIALENFICNQASMS